MMGDLQLQRGSRPSASLLNSCHQGKKKKKKPTDTLNWRSRLEETGLKYLHNFTEDGRKLLKHVSRGPLAAGVTLHPEGPVALGCHPAPPVPGGGGRRARSGKVTLADPIRVSHLFMLLRAGEELMQAERCTEGRTLEKKKKVLACVVCVHCLHGAH